MNASVLNPFPLIRWISNLTKTDVAKLNLIHVSGTKGKGSTYVFTRGFLSAHGQRTGFPIQVGMYSGPHLTARERIQIYGHHISPDLFTQYFFEVWDQLISPDPTSSTMPRYRQSLALLAFHTFIREKVDAAIFEVHYGGEYDSANVIRSPVATGISSLGLDHTAQLGWTLESIAWHKAGIFRPGAPAFAAIQEPGPAEVTIHHVLDRGTTVTFVSPNTRLPTDQGLANAFVHAREPGYMISDEDIQKGITCFSWPGRLQVINDGKLQWFLDGAHNILSLEHAAEWFARATTSTNTQHRCRTLIFTHLSQSRDGVALVRFLAQALSSHDASPEGVIFTTFRAIDPTLIDPTTAEEPKSPVRDLLERYSSTWKTSNPHTIATIQNSYQDAIRMVKQLAEGEVGMRVLITGCLYLVGALSSFWSRRSTKVMMEFPLGQQRRGLNKGHLGCQE
ncbi:Mur ligase [Aspergillus varians]